MRVRFYESRRSCGTEPPGEQITLAVMVPDAWVDPLDRWTCLRALSELEDVARAMRGS
jgi:hypothetical protein